uniref:Glutathione transferase n=1 Tax=Tetraselmis chuii TaxID=63592 RepID=A0A7S1SV85_9CHLO|mmetsp:Transcript_29914/g.53550  ORF Transcript_29914/g.53550 Transcript_29914/m.53550 type:complete len:291 (+) Transcript_29914:151-1023(+)
MLLACSSNASAGGGAAAPALKYLSAWFCPFAHRATIALHHHAQHLNWEWVESLGWEKRASSDANSRKQANEPVHENWYHWKHPDLLKHTPAGLIPTVVDSRGRSIHESLVVVDYVDDLARQAAEARGTADDFQSLLSDDPMERAQMRLAAEEVNRKLCSPYYTMLVRTDATEQRAAFDQFLKDLGTFENELREPFARGDRLSVVDVALLPWAQRFYILEHYRGFEIPPEMERYHAWLAACRALPPVANSTPDHDEYLKHIGRYADSSARSKVANAVRSGRSAHELDPDHD